MQEDKEAITANEEHSIFGVSVVHGSHCSVQQEGIRETAGSPWFSPLLIPAQFLHMVHSNRVITTLTISG